MSESKAFEEQPIVGMFGVCGDTTFRQDLFIPAYEERGIEYFNPQVDDWRPELADIEADHLVYDVVQCWPVTGDTYASGSLTEQGYSIASSLRSDSPFPKFVIPMIDLDLSDELTDEVARKESIRARKLASTHLAQSASPNIFVVSSLEEMLDTSIKLHDAAVAIVGLTRSTNPQYARYARDLEDSRNLSKALEEMMLKEANLK